MVDLMAEKDDALFDRNVRRVVRNCILVFCPVWVPVLGAVGWWLTDLSASVGYNTKSLAKIEVNMEYLVIDMKGRRP